MNEDNQESRKQFEIMEIVKPQGFSILILILSAITVALYSIPTCFYSNFCRA